MKKFLLLIFAALFLPSCYFWNSSLDNVIRAYYFGETIGHNVEGIYTYDFDLAVGGEIMVFTHKYADYSKNDDLNSLMNFFSENNVENTYGRQSSYFSRFCHGSAMTSGGDFIFLRDDSYLLQGDAGVVYGSDQLYIDVNADAAMGDYAYDLDGTTLEVINLKTWADEVKEAQSAGTLSDYLEANSSNPAPAAEIEISELSSYTERMQLSGDLLGIYSYNSTTETANVVLIDISDPAVPNYSVCSAPYFEYNIYDFQLTGNRLYLYGEIASADFDNYEYKFLIYDVSDYQNVPDPSDITFSQVTNQDIVWDLNMMCSDNWVYAFSPNPGVLHAWNTADLSAPIYSKIDMVAGLHYNASLSNDTERRFAVDDNRIYIPSETMVEIIVNNNGVLSLQNYAYVGVPLKAVYKFSDDPYIYAIGYSSINIVSVKE